MRICIYYISAKKKSKQTESYENYSNWILLLIISVNTERFLSFFVFLFTYFHMCSAKWSKKKEKQFVFCLSFLCFIRFEEGEWTKISLQCLWVVHLTDMSYHLFYIYEISLKTFFSCFLFYDFTFFFAIANTCVLLLLLFYFDRTMKCEWNIWKYTKLMLFTDVSPRFS